MFFSPLALSLVLAGSQLATAVPVQGTSLLGVGPAVLPTGSQAITARAVHSNPGGPMDPKPTTITTSVPGGPMSQQPLPQINSTDTPGGPMDPTGSTTTIPMVIPTVETTNKAGATITSTRGPRHPGGMPAAATTGSLPPGFVGPKSERAPAPTNFARRTRASLKKRDTASDVNSILTQLESAFKPILTQLEGDLTSNAAAQAIKTDLTKLVKEIEKAATDLQGKPAQVAGDLSTVEATMKDLLKSTMKELQPILKAMQSDSGLQSTLSSAIKKLDSQLSSLVKSLESALPGLMPALLEDGELTSLLSSLGGDLGSVLGLRQATMYGRRT